MAPNAVYLDLTLPVGGKKELPHPFYSYLSLSNLTFKKPFGRPQRTASEVRKFMVNPTGKIFSIPAWVPNLSSNQYQ